MKIEKEEEEEEEDVGGDAEGNRKGKMCKTQAEVKHEDKLKVRLSSFSQKMLHIINEEFPP